MSRGEPFALANQGDTLSILTLRKGTNNLGSLGFPSQDYYSPRDRRVNISLPSAWLTPQPPLSALETYKILLQASEAGLDMTSWLIRLSLSDHPSSPVGVEVECCKSCGHLGNWVTDCSATRIPSQSITGCHSQQTGVLLEGGVLPFNWGTVSIFYRPSRQSGLIICLHTVKWFWVLLFITNNSIWHQSIVCSQINDQTVLF